MAHFAELDENNVVKRVIVVSNNIPTSDGPLGENDMHIDGEIWCKNFFKGGTWKQTSYNGNFRKKYAGIGDTYDSEKDVFIQKKLYPSWSLNSNNDWQAPITYPSITTYIDEKNRIVDYIIRWDEEAYQADNKKGWKSKKIFEEEIEINPDYEWNVDLLIWEQI
jgi:hypothetical protein